ncbi:MAG: tRNA delta(2)-isopentenylpyrophosphate transferase [Acidobacteria bacterium]|nr:tRNA delta(2)-isopentenylpyrophosphate transferase [Acidobacteriota bacterium]
MKPLIVIAGPTGVGKSELAVRIAEEAGGEVVNYDSVQVYRGFDVGSAKPDATIRARVPHHLFDVIDADEELNAADYARRAREICAEIDARGKRVVLAGGTFFYLRALLTGLPEMPPRDEAIRDRLRRIATSRRGPARLHRWLTKVDAASAAKIAIGDRHRVERALEVWIVSGRPISSWPSPTADSADVLPAIRIGVRAERARLVKVLDARVERMYAGGLIAETKALLERWPRSARPFGTIGYKEAAAVVAGELPIVDAIAETKRRTRAYAKRQMTWLRGERDVHWIDAAAPDTTFNAAMRLITDFEGTT